MKVVFSGDIAFSNYFKSSNFDSVIDENIREFLENNDYNIFNIEGALTNQNSLKLKGASHKSDPKSINILKQMNCNVFNLGNNHIMDCGQVGLADTLRLANENNIKTIGAGLNINMASESIFLKDSDTTVSLISISHVEGLIASKSSAGVFADDNQRIIKNRIFEMKKKSDWVVVIYHGGEEYSSIPNPNRRKKLIRYLNYGADIIVSHHAHVTQGYERINDKYIFYSLGNFIFDTDNQRRMVGTDTGLLVKLIFTKTEVKVETMFTKIDRTNKRITSNDEAILNEINIGTLKNDWSREAYRIIFKNRINGNSSYKENERHIDVPQRSKFGILRKMFKKSLDIIKHNNVRDIYVGAVKHYIKLKIKIKSL